MAKDTKANVIEFDTDAIRAREAEVAQETDEQIVERLRDRFRILTDMTRAVKRGNVRALIVSGPPGVGKSYGVEDVLQKDDLFNTIAQRKPKYEIVKGAMSALGLYAKLHEFRDKGNVIVFDDCDSVLLDDLSLNLLKAALDTSKRRRISWNTDSRLLRTEDIPSSFEFSAGAIFITNIKFEHVRSKKLRDHLSALESRCHYIDLEMDTSREQLLRIRQIVNDGMLQEYEFEEEAKQEILNFIETNADSLRELSLRTVLKIADLRCSFPDEWQKMAETTCFRRKQGRKA
jgi:DNA polymerase III delta prime subunit